ncbi:uncharacterized protein LOC109843511 isoform X2 [Asparagus officinalis]|uniref:uncharacterized protein LOC109843511 isoform X2 n=1 Tax=Asparagus officinalis TaxID=4686 RepID=UPI00098E3FA7|nr:uncharacterized protein LOC109843511 isoform X2 [Asparagus officinalis]
MNLDKKDKFDAEDMEQKRELVMRHLRDLWNKWRGDMHRKYVKENSLQVALRNKPTEVSVDDWDWLVKEHYFSSKFQKASQQNTLNRGKRKMLHHTGSKSFRQIAWELDEIVQVKQANPSLSDIEIVEKIWGKQSHGHITVFGGGTTLKDLRGPLPSRSDLEARVIEEKRKNQMLQQRLDEQEQQQQRMSELESQVKAMQKLFF